MAVHPGVGQGEPLGTTLTDGDARSPRVTEVSSRPARSPGPVTGQVNYFFLFEPGVAFGAGLALVCGSALLGPRGAVCFLSSAISSW